MQVWIRAIFASAVVLSACLFADIAYAAKRVALVVGNDQYSNIPQLRKAVNDARTMSETLKKLGFAVLTAENQNRKGLSETLLAFDRMIEKGDTAFFFFAGHGFEIGGENYLLPTDVPSATVGQEELIRDGAIAAERIITRVQTRGAGTAIFVFDACRNNPFERTGVARALGRRRPRRDDAAGGRVRDLFGRRQADRARPPVERRQQSELGVHPQLLEDAGGAWAQSRADRQAHAVGRARPRARHPSPADAGVLRPDRRRRRAGAG